MSIYLSQEGRCSTSNASKHAIHFFIKSSRSARLLVKLGSVTSFSDLKRIQFQVNFARVPVQLALHFFRLFKNSSSFQSFTHCKVFRARGILIMRLKFYERFQSGQHANTLCHQPVKSQRLHYLAYAIFATPSKNFDTHKKPLCLLI